MFSMALLIVSLVLGLIVVEDGRIGKKSVNEEEIELARKQLTTYQLFIIDNGACLAK